MTTTVIVLDGEQRAALAVTRSLGQHGLRVIVCSAVEQPIAGASRWCRRAYRVPDVSIDANALVLELKKIASDENVAIVFPVSDASLTTLLHEPEIAGVRIAGPDLQTYMAVSNKASLVQRAATLGVPVPRSIRVRTREEFAESLSEWTGPVVIKPALSRFLSDGRIRRTSVVLAGSPESAHSMLDRLDWIDSIPCVLQEFIPGHGAGVFTVYSNGGPLAWFAHRRIREKPPSGGVSVLCESAPLDDELRAYSRQLLDDVGWLGPAMVEFRIDNKGRPWLMEINGRFWGSLQLSIDSGLDIPWMWYRILSGDSPMPTYDYRTGRRLRWLLGDLDSLYLTFRDPTTSFGQRARALGRFLNFFSPRTRFDVLRLSDPKPFFRESGAWLRAAFSHRAQP